jgi:dolichol-phosphate mannosyltransferase
MKLSVVVPMYNEEGIIQAFFERMEGTKRIFLERFGIPASQVEVIFVNDGSRDGTLAKLRELCNTQPGYILINLSRNHGHQIAITAGIDTAVGDAVAVIDGDLQDPPEVIADLYHTMLQGYDVVYAVRKKRDGETFFKLFTARIFYRLLKKLTNVDIPVDTGDFRIMSRRVVNVLSSMKERHRFIRGMISWIGFQQTGMEYERHERFAGETKYTLSKMLKFAFDGITSFSSIPLKLSSYLGMITALLGFLYGLYVIALRIFAPEIHVELGWSSLVIFILLLGGVQLLALGMIGEYLGRIHDESKFRPLYIIENIYRKESE